MSVSMLLFTMQVQRVWCKPEDNRTHCSWISAPGSSSGGWTLKERPFVLSKFEGEGTQLPQVPPTHPKRGVRCTYFAFLANLLSMRFISCFLSLPLPLLVHNNLHTILQDCEVMHFSRVFIFSFQPLHLTYMGLSIKDWLLLLNLQQQSLSFLQRWIKSIHHHVNLNTHLHSRGTTWV